MSRRALALLLLAFVGAAFLVYAPALDGPFVSDDVGYVLTNRYVQALDVENLAAILDPRGVPAAYTANYAPLHLLLVALEWQLFGASPRGYHVVNVLLHALTSALLVALFAAWGIPRAAAVLGGALFLLHPANVEAVAWIFQLKTIVAVGLAVGALLALPRRPLLGALLFGLALLAKLAAVFALPAALLWAWARARRDGRAPLHWGWLALWVAALGLVALPEWIAFERLGHAGRPLAEDPLVLLRSVAALGARYVVMAATSFGVSTFHAPELSRSWLDPWWWLALAVAGLLLWRSVRALRRGSEEAAFWLWAAAAWAPISQLFPFLYPMADRYLYAIAPGLIGGALRGIAGGLGGPHATLRRGAGRAPFVGLAGLGLGVGLALGFAWHAAARAALWRSEARLVADAALHYPDGIEANLLRASAAAGRGDVAATVEALRRAAERGFDRFELLEHHPAFAGMRQEPAFRALVAEVAGRWLENASGRAAPNQAELHALGRARLARGELELAIASLEQALAQGGPWQDEVLATLAQARAAARRAAPPRAAPPGPP